MPRIVDIAIALLDRGADPTAPGMFLMSPLMYWVYKWVWISQSRDRRHLDKITSLLQESRIRTTVNLQTGNGDTVLHHACSLYGMISSPSIVHLLLQAGANPSLIGYHGRYHGQTPLVYLRRQHSEHRETIALLEQAPDAEKSWILVKARRLVVAAAASTVSTPSYSQSRVARGQPLPHVALAPIVGGQNLEDEEGGSKLRALLASVVGLGGGPEGDVMPRDVYYVLLDLLMPSWDPLRNGIGGWH